jgi:hypothetical protein
VWKSDFHAIDKAVSGAFENGQVIMEVWIGNDCLECLSGRHDLSDANESFLKRVVGDATMNSIFGSPAKNHMLLFYQVQK